MDRGAWRATQPGVTQNQTEVTEHAHHLLIKLRKPLIIKVPLHVKCPYGIIR